MSDTAELWDEVMPARLVPPRLTRADAALRRRLSRRRRLEGAIEGCPASFVFALPVDPLARPDGIDAVAAVGSARIRLHLPRTLTDWLYRRMAPEPAGRALDPDQALLLADLALTPFIAALEAALGETIGPLERLTGPKPEMALGLAVELRAADGFRAEARLGLPVVLTERVAALIEALPALPIDFGDLPIPVSVRLGDVSLTLAEVRSLGPGDIILHDPVAAEPSLRALAIGETWAATARAETGRVRLATPFRPLPPLPESATMSEFEPRAAAFAGPDATAEIDLDQLPIRVVFEAGRAEISLRELRGLGVGHVFELGRDAGDPIDIMANGKRIGIGELVRIGDELGIRVRQLFGHG